MDSYEDAVVCPVCFQLYDDPRNLPCGHSFCFSCITQVAGQRQHFPCPSCRSGVQLDIRGVNGLPKNYTLGRIIELQENMSSAMCSEHKRSLDMFCAQCEMMICFKCLVKLHSGHNIMETEEICKIRKGRLTELLESTKQWQAQVQEKIVGVRLLRESLQKNIEGINANIDESFRRWTDNLEMQRKILRQHVNDKREQMMKVFDDYLMVLDSGNTEISIIQTEMNTTLSKDTISVVELFGSLDRSCENVGKKSKETITASFNPPKDLKIDISAPWMEEAIQNIKLFEPGQNQENSFTRSMSKILEENETLQRTVLDLRLIAEKYQSRIKKTQRRLNRKLDESENETSALKAVHKEEVEGLNKEIRKLQKSLTLDKSYEKREKELKTKCDELEADIASYKKKLTKSEDAKIHLEIKITEMNYMASNELRDNNPYKADLSDPNRPTKLSEQFSELYDNEWTDAFDELEKMLPDKNEKKIISYLRNFVLEIHSLCSEISSSKLKTIEEAFVKPTVPSEYIKIPTEIFKIIKDGMKIMAPKLLNHTRERVQDRLEKKYFTDPVAGCLQHQNVKQYIDKCTEVCWYMSVQDPQLVMDGSKSPNEKFDSNKYREYTKKGPYKEFVVWPVLYLYRGGQMLCKGVAQGATKKESCGQQ